MPTTQPGPTLVVIRGNSGSGKSAVARGVQKQFAPGACVVVEQDLIRTELVGEPDQPGALTIELIALIAKASLAAGKLTIVEGILNSSRYGRMLERLSSESGVHCLFYAFDLTFEETVRRHELRAKRADFGVDEMRSWYHGWQPLDFVEETRFEAGVTEEAAVARVVADVGSSPPQVGSSRDLHS